MANTNTLHDFKTRYETDEDDYPIKAPIEITYEEFEVLCDLADTDLSYADQLIVSKRALEVIRELAKRELLA